MELLSDGRRDEGLAGMELPSDGRRDEGLAGMELPSDGRRDEGLATSAQTSVTSLVPLGASRKVDSSPHISAGSTKCTVRSVATVLAVSERGVISMSGRVAGNGWSTGRSAALDRPHSPHL